MEVHDNDNDELSFVSLAALTANVTRYLCKEEKPNSEANQQAGADAEIEQHRETERGKVIVK